MGYIFADTPYVSKDIIDAEFAKIERDHLGAGALQKLGFKALLSNVHVHHIFTVKLMTISLQ